MGPDRYLGGISFPEPVAAVAFPTATVVRTQAQHEEAIRGILEHLQGVPIEEKMSNLRFRMVNSDVGRENSKEAPGSSHTVKLGDHP
ncbi:hypothetical protein Tco_0749458 [Tanacetum coccineum]|uniref:Uncharacterized protein n=1 Tax=Tanacetum coccineum TaxID=301880 RepID=A0ABQ4Z1J4_9ASTR